MLLYLAQTIAALAATLRSFSELPPVQEPVVRWQSASNSRHSNNIDLNICNNKNFLHYSSISLQSSTFSVEFALLVISVQLIKWIPSHLSWGDVHTASLLLSFLSLLSFKYAVTADRAPITSTTRCKINFKWVHLSAF